MKKQECDNVISIDISKERVAMINCRESPLVDKEIIEYLFGHKLDLTAITDAETAYKSADFVIIATPTNYDPDNNKNYFDTYSVETVIMGAIVRRIGRRKTLLQRGYWKKLGTTIKRTSVWKIWSLRSSSNNRSISINDEIKC